MIFISAIFDIAIFGILVPSLFIIISEAVDNFFKFLKYDFIFLKISGVFLVCAGIVFIIWAYYSIVRIGKGYTLEFFRKSLLPLTKRLVTVGPYSKIRHPMVAGYLSVLLGITFIRGSIGGIFMLFPLVFIVAVLYLIFFEEKALYVRFKEEFKTYKSNTNFIIPWFKVRW